MIPEQFVWMEKFSLNTSGKIDRRALPKPNLTLLKNNFIAPSSPEEELICSAFSHILGLEKVSIYDNFYQLGGNSLKTIMLVSRLQTHFKVTVSDVFQHKTPSELAKNIVFSENNLRQKLEHIKNMYKEISTVMPAKAGIQEKKPIFHFQLNIKPLQQIILTGATGYLGCNILYQLLTTTNYNIVTLIRATSQQEATNRLASKFAYYFDMDLHIYHDRLSVYIADLEKETVDWHPNYDNTKKEPSVLPAAAPNLLLNVESASNFVLGFQSTVFAYSSMASCNVNEFI